MLKMLALTVSQDVSKHLQKKRLKIQSLHKIDSFLKKFKKRKRLNPLTLSKKLFICVSLDKEVEIISHKIFIH